MISLYLLIFLPNLGDSSLSYDLTSLTDLKGVVDSSICSAFYLLGLNDDFQPLYVPEWKLKVSGSVRN